MSKNKLIALGILCFVLIVGTVVSLFCFKSGAIATDNVVVRTDLFTVSLPESGIVKEVFVKPKQSISSGQLIAEIDVKLPGAKPVSVDNSNVEATKKKLDEAEKNYTNSAMMYKDGVISQQEYDESLEKLAVAREKYQKEVGNKNSDTNAQKVVTVTRKVHSPMDGVVSINYVKKGENTKANTPIILADGKTPKLIAYFNPKYKEELSVGKKVVVKSNQYRGKSFDGVIESVSDKTETLNGESYQFLPVTIRFVGNMNGYSFDKKHSFIVSLKD